MRVMNKDVMYNYAMEQVSLFVYTRNIKKRKRERERKGDE
jgi:hypothetical protein